MENKLTEYKVRAFDLGIMIERMNTERNAIVQEIIKLSQQAKPTVKEKK